MLRYETTKVSIPANGERKGVILTVQPGKKITLKGLANDHNVVSIVFIEIKENRLIRCYYNVTAGYGNFIPLNMEVNGPEEISVGAEDLSGSGGDINFVLMYEE